MEPSVHSQGPPREPRPDAEAVANNSFPVGPNYIVNVEKHAEAMSGQQAGPFDDEATRSGFIQKVLAIALLQAVAAGAIMVWFMSCYYSIHYTMREFKALFIPLSAVGFFVTLGLMVYCSEARKKSPYKYLFLVAHPGTFGIFLSVSMWDILLEELTYVWSFFCLSLAIMLLHSIFSFQTNFEFSLKNSVFINATSLVAMFAIIKVWLIPYYINVVPLILFTVVVFLLSTYVMCQVLVMTGTAYRFEVTAADYLLGVIYLHIDYVHILKLRWNNQLTPAMRNA